MQIAYYLLHISITLLSSQCWSSNRKDKRPRQTQIQSEIVLVKCCVD